MKNAVTLLDDLGHVIAVTRNHSKFLTSHNHSFARARRAYWQVATHDYLSNFSNIYNEFFIFIYRVMISKTAVYPGELFVAQRMCRHF